jgi:pimeloyl-ACP methyl ester carboxylesterase
MTSMPEFARALRAVDEAVGPAYGIVAHSMGASASALAMAQGLTVTRAVFLAPAANPAAYLAPFAKTFGIRQDVMRRLRERSQRRVAFSWDDLDVPSMARQLEIPLLVFHDEDDRVVPATDGAAIAAAWPKASLVSTTGLGHRGVTSDPAIIRQAVQFLTGDEYAEAPPNADWGEEALERELWNREARRV